MGVNTDTVSALINYFKTHYQPEFPKAFNEEAVGWALAQRVKRDFKGGVEVLGVQTGRAGGVGARGETQGLPRPRGFVPKQMQVAEKSLFKVFEISHSSVVRSIGEDAAFGEVLGKEIVTGFDRLKKLANIYFYGDGRGVLATVVTGGSLGGTVGNTLQITVDTTRYLVGCEGDLIALWTTAGGATIVANGGQLPNAGTTPADESVQIQSIDSETLMTLVRLATDGAACTVATSNAIRLYGDSTTTGSVRTDNMPTGLSAFADDGSSIATIQNVDRTTAGNTNLKGQLIDAGGDNLTRNYVYRLNDKIRRKGTLFADVLIWDVSMRREYLQVIQPDVRFAPVKELDGGYEDEAMVITLGKKTWRLVEDVDVPYGKVFSFPRESLLLMELAPMEIDASTGSPLKQALPYGVAGAGDVFYGYARWKGNFATHNPNAFGQLINLAYSLE